MEVLKLADRCISITPSMSTNVSSFWKFRYRPALVPPRSLTTIGYCFSDVSKKTHKKTRLPGRQAEKSSCPNRFVRYAPET
jgi:hypothetical protein